MGRICSVIGMTRLYKLICGFCHLLPNCRRDHLRINKRNILQDRSYLFCVLREELDFAKRVICRTRGKDMIYISEDPFIPIANVHLQSPLSFTYQIVIS